MNTTERIPFDENKITPQDLFNAANFILEHKGWWDENTVYDQSNWSMEKDVGILPNFLTFGSRTVKAEQICKTTLCLWGGAALMLGMEHPTTGPSEAWRDKSEQHEKCYLAVRHSKEVNALDALYEASLMTEES